MKELKKLIVSARQNDDEAMLQIIKIFTPLINKYTRMMNYDEDFKSEMICKLIRLAKKEIDPEKFSDESGYAILKYIKSSMHHQYILLSQKKRSIYYNENSFDFETLANISDSGNKSKNELDDLLLRQTLKEKLTGRELDSVLSIVVLGFTASEVAQKLGISKQAVNQCKNRALKKLKQDYEKMHSA